MEQEKTPPSASSIPSPQSQTRANVPYKQIRALYDEHTVTVYMAFSTAIALPAVQQQNLSASPDFLPGRMTWIKPSWCWMMYRSNYSLKDPHQAHILAIKTPHHHFQHLLSLASTTSYPGPLTPEERAKPVRVQWDPERSPTLQALPYRSIQIGLSRDVKAWWVKEGIVAIEDVTARARELQRVIVSEEGVGWGDLVERGLVPREEVYELEAGLRGVLGME